MHEGDEDGLLQIVEEGKDSEELHLHDLVLCGEVDSDEEISLGLGLRRGLDHDLEVTSGVEADILEVQVGVHLCPDVRSSSLIHIGDLNRGAALSLVGIALRHRHVEAACKDVRGERRLRISQVLGEQCFAPRQTLLAVPLLRQLLCLGSLLIRGCELPTLVPRGGRIRLIRSAGGHPCNLHLWLLPL